MGSKIPETVRELRPHFAMRGIDWIWELARAAIVAVLVGIWQWCVHHWDIITLVIVFIVCLALLVWRDLSHGRSKPKLGVSPPANPEQALPDTPVTRTTQETFQRLSALHKFILRRIYLNPGISIWTLMQEGISLGLPHVYVDSLIRWLTQGTNLVERQHTGTLAVNPAVSGVVVMLLDRDETIPTGEAITSVAQGVTEALTENHQIELKNQEKRCQHEKADMMAALREAEGLTAAINRISNRVWVLKRDAREIKRRWPQCAFVLSPLDRPRWSPRVGEPETGMGGTELEKAIAWHDAFSAYMAEKTNREYQRHSDFDGVMAALDRDERMDRDLPQ